MPEKALFLDFQDPKKAQIMNFWGPEFPNCQLAILQMKADQASPRSDFPTECSIWYEIELLFTYVETFHDVLLGNDVMMMSYFAEIYILLFLFQNINPEAKQMFSSYFAAQISINFTNHWISLFARVLLVTWCGLLTGFKQNFNRAKCIKFSYNAAVNMEHPYNK